jgi:magnesium chelatase family protein
VLAIVSSATVLGVDGRAVTVEIHVSSGLPCFTIVGLPDTACREARDRVRSALLSSDLPWPNRRVTVNLAPSGLRKVGSGLDLAIAVGLLVAAEEIEPGAIEHLGFLGELGLDGSLRPVPGMVSLAEALPGDVAVVPVAAAAEAALVARHQVRPVANLREVALALKGEELWPEAPPPAVPVPPPPEPDLADVRGQPVARLALEVAAAGQHHLLMVGPPGSGKTMLARRLPGLLPRLEQEHALEATRIHSAAGIELRSDTLIWRPPLRAPHHGASPVSVIGGGTALMRPGEVSLAHRGVLFLDEMGEFAPQVLDTLRQPLEEGEVRVSRAKASATFPARFLLAGAMNPCPCGEGSSPGACICSDVARARYRRRLSGPLLDRFDLRVEVLRPDVDDLLHGPPGECTAVVAERVAVARDRARSRGVWANAELGAAALDDVAPFSDGASLLVEQALRSGRLSARGLQRIRRVALTIADLWGQPPPLGSDHVSLALGLRVDPVGFGRG